MGKKLSKADAPAQRESSSQRPVSNNRPITKAPVNQGVPSASSSTINSNPSALTSPPAKSTKQVSKTNEDDVLLAQKYTHHGDKPINVDDFELLKVLGKGSYGKVMLCKKKDEKPPVLYAMKTLRKAALIKRGQVTLLFTRIVMFLTILASNLN